jgi:hypothetical protein
MATWRMIGNFQNIHLPSLVSVGGNVEIESSVDDFTCPITQLQNAIISRGSSFICAGDVSGVNETTTAIPTTATVTTSSVGSPPSSASSSARTSAGNHQTLDKLGKTLSSNDVLMQSPGDICDTFVSLVDGKLVYILQWSAKPFRLIALLPNDNRNYYGYRT